MPIGKVERQAIKARNTTAHGAASYSDEKIVELLGFQSAYQTLFNRVILKILGFEGKYIDTTAASFVERGIDEPPEEQA